MIDDFVTKSISKCFLGTLLVIFEICLELVPGGFKNVMSVLLRYLFRHVVKSW